MTSRSPWPSRASDPTRAWRAAHAPRARARTSTLQGPGTGTMSLERSSFPPPLNATAPNDTRATDSLSDSGCVRRSARRASSTFSAPRTSFPGPTRPRWRSTSAAHPRRCGHGGVRSGRPRAPDPVQLGRHRRVGAGGSSHVGRRASPTHSTGAGGRRHARSLGGHLAGAFRGVLQDRFGVVRQRLRPARVPARRSRPAPALAVGGAAHRRHRRRSGDARSRVHDRHVRGLPARRSGGHAGRDGRDLPAGVHLRRDQWAARSSRACFARCQRLSGWRERGVGWPSWRSSPPSWDARPSWMSPRPCWPPCRRSYFCSSS